MRIRLTTTGIALALLVCGLAADAEADTVYMKNGRIIHSSAVRVEGDRVFVRLYQGEVAFPLDKVERIVEDDEVETSSTRPSGAGTEPTAGDPEAGVVDADAAAGDDPAAASGTPDTAAGGAPAAGDPAADPQGPPEPAPEETRQYWQNRIIPLNQQLERMDAELASLRSRTGADVQAQVGRIEAQRERVQSQLDEIFREGRRLGVPPGWLR